MTKRVKREPLREGYRTGYRKPPLATRFKPGESGNLKGRPKEAKNFATVISQELKSRIPVTENGKPKKISKRQAIAKQMINKAVTGDHRATQIVLNEARAHEGAPAAGEPLTVFDTPEHHLVMADIVRRIRLMKDELSDRDEGHADEET